MQENIFKKSIHKKINVIITFIKEIFHEYIIIIVIIESIVLINLIKGSFNLLK